MLESAHNYLESAHNYLESAHNYLYSIDHANNLNHFRAIKSFLVIEEVLKQELYNDSMHISPSVTSMN